MTFLSDGSDTFEVFSEEWITNYGLLKGSLWVLLVRLTTPPDNLEPSGKECTRCRSKRPIGRDWFRMGVKHRAECVTLEEVSVTA